jgi:hypothetical protein
MCRIDTNPERQNHNIHIERGGLLGIHDVDNESAASEKSGPFLAVFLAYYTLCKGPYREQGIR